MNTFIKLSVLSLFLLNLVACNSATTETRSDKSKTAPAEKTYNSNVSLFSSMLNDVSFEDKKSSSNDYELYFHDSKGRRYFSDIHSSDVLSASLDRLIDDLMRSASRRMSNYSRKRNLNLVLEIEGSGEYLGSVTTAAEQYILSKKRYTLQSQDSDMKNIVSKILKRELDPFYQGGNDVNLTAKASDFILYLKFKNLADNINFKASLLSKSGEVLAVKTNKVNLLEDKDNSSWVRAAVPHADGNGSKTYNVQRRAITEHSLFGRGSKLNSVTNMNFEQANKYCLTQGSLLSGIYAFEHARRTRKLVPPSGNAKEELIAPYDEDEDETFLKPGDHLELSDDGSANNIIVFNWVTETYSAVASSYRSSRMTFRCMKNL